MSDVNLGFSKQQFEKAQKDNVFSRVRETAELRTQRVLDMETERTARVQAKKEQILSPLEQAEAERAAKKLRQTMMEIQHTTRKHESQPITRKTSLELEEEQAAALAAGVPYSSSQPITRKTSLELEEEEAAALAKYASPQPSSSQSITRKTSLELEEEAAAALAKQQPSESSASLGFSKAQLEKAQDINAAEQLMSPVSSVAASVKDVTMQDSPARNLKRKSDRDHPDNNPQPAGDKNKEPAKHHDKDKQTNTQTSPTKQPQLPPETHRFAHKRMTDEEYEAALKQPKHTRSSELNEQLEYERQFRTKQAEEQRKAQTDNVLSRLRDTSDLRSQRIAQMETERKARVEAELQTAREKQTPLQQAEAERAAKKLRQTVQQIQQTARAHQAIAQARKTSLELEEEEAAALARHVAQQEQSEG